MSIPIVAIDLGTSRSAMIVSEVGEESAVTNILAPRECGEEVDQNGKVLTCILLRSEGDTLVAESFGSKAESDYAAKSVQNDTGDFAFIKNFKLLLHEGEKVDPSVGRTRSLREVKLSLVIAKILEIFKLRALEFLNESCTSVVNKDSIIWVLTIPAIWSEYSKRMMRRCAFDAGLTSDINSRNLLLCLEPEAACFSALYPPVNCSTDISTPENELSKGVKSLTLDENMVCLFEECNSAGPAIAELLSNIGTKFIVLDAGGGTVDLTSYEVISQAPFRIKQLAAPTGGPFGSTVVDENYMSFIRDLIGRDAAAALDHRMHVKLAVLASWEIAKLRPDIANEVTQINLGPICEVLAELKLATLPVLVAEYKCRHPECGLEALGEQRIRIHPHHIKTFFQSSLQAIAQCLDDYLTTTAATRATHVLLVGGYSNSAFLWDTVHDTTVKRGVNSLLRVRRPDLAIVQGAVIYAAKRRSVLSSRVSAYTYGMSLRSPVCHMTPISEEALTGRQLHHDDEGRPYVDVFHTFVQKGFEIPFQYITPRQWSSPFSKYSRTSVFPVLASTTETPVFPDDEGVKEIGRYSVPLDMSVPFGDREHMTEMEFGDVEIWCRTFECKRGELVGESTLEAL